MISQAHGTSVKNAYTNNANENKDVSQKATTKVSSQGDTSKIEQIKEALDAGEYKVNLQALSEKIADELL